VSPAQLIRASEERVLWHHMLANIINDEEEDDDDDEGRINFSVALSPKTTRTRNNKFKQ